jgi:hypothetical protein
MRAHLIYAKCAWINRSAYGGNFWLAFEHVIESHAKMCHVRRVA